MAHQGSCHCGAVAFTVEGEPGAVIECNCTHCSRKGLLLWFVPRTQFKLTTSDATLGTYHFNKHVIDHQFCTTCGCQPFALGKDPKGNEMASINVRCLTDIDLGKLERKPWDGLSR